MRGAQCIETEARPTRSQDNALIIMILPPMNEERSAAPHQWGWNYFTDQYRDLNQKTADWLPARTWHGRSRLLHQRIAVTLGVLLNRFVSLALSESILSAGRSGAVRVMRGGTKRGSETERPGDEGQRRARACVLLCFINTDAGGI